MVEKVAKSVAVIGGADGPTSVWIAGKTGKPKLSQKVKRAIYKRKAGWVEKKITANPHTLAEVVAYLQEKCGAVEISKQSRKYLELYNSLKESLIVRHKPELLGELADIKRPKEYDEVSIKEMWERIELRSKKIESIPDVEMPMDFRVFEIELVNGGNIQFSIDMVWEVFGGSFSGNRKVLRQIKHIYKDVYLYYGVSEEDIKKRSERYRGLVAAMCV